jgi:hypothetical protein
MRVLAYFSFAGVICALFTARHARAEYKDSTLAFGREMLELSQAQNHEVTTIVFNGQKMWLGSSVTTDSPEAVIKRYEAYCASKPTNLDAFAEADKKEDVPRLAKSGAIRVGGEDGKEGAVMCFVKGEKSKPTTGESFNTFFKTGELGAIGDLRYVYTSKNEKTGKTLVLTAWTDSKFNLLEMIGDPDKDCAGNDFPEVPRVPNAIRTISAHAEGTPYGINVYRTTDKPTETIAFYDKAMHEKGWFTYDPELNEKDHSTIGRAYMKDGVVLTGASSVQPVGNFIALGLAGVSAQDDPKKLGRRQ